MPNNIKIFKTFQPYIGQITEIDHVIDAAALAAMKVLRAIPRLPDRAFRPFSFNNILNHRRMKEEQNHMLKVIRAWTEMRGGGKGTILIIPRSYISRYGFNEADLRTSNIYFSDWVKGPTLAPKVKASDPTYIRGLGLDPRHMAEPEDR